MPAVPSGLWQAGLCPLQGEPLFFKGEGEKIRKRVSHFLSIPQVDVLSLAVSSSFFIYASSKEDSVRRLGLP
jgi:hypothetical protein